MRGQEGLATAAGSQSRSFLKSRRSQTLRGLFSHQSTIERQGTLITGPEMPQGGYGGIKVEAGLCFQRIKRLMDVD